MAMVHADILKALADAYFRPIHEIKGGNRAIEEFFMKDKGQLISKVNCQVMNSSKKRTNEFVFTTMRRVFEEIEDTQKNLSKLLDLLWESILYLKHFTVHTTVQYTLSIMSQGDS
jgi:hypothetical protein